MGFIEVSDLVQIICNNLYIYQNDINHLLIQVAGSPLQVLFRRHVLSAEPAVKPISSLGLSCRPLLANTGLGLI